MTDKQTLLVIGGLAVLGIYLFNKKKEVVDSETEESSFVNAGGDKHLRTKRLLKKYNRRGGFQNASGCKHPRFWCAPLNRCVSSAASCRSVRTRRI
tara:strand:+ start:655 stop:942 length:288 start_codon:yes stop_codon:yes gene_type:complete